MLFKAFNNNIRKENSEALEPEHSPYSHTTKHLNFLRKSRRSQSALEYMMTYGWAILIIVIVAVILYSMGIFNPSSSVTFTSSGFSPFKVSSSLCTSLGLDISIIAGPMPNDASSLVVNKLFITSATGTNTSTVKYPLPYTISLTSGKSTTILVPSISCSSAGAKYSLLVNLQYSYSTTAGNIVTNTTGTIAGTSSSPVPTTFSAFGLPSNADFTVNYEGVNKTNVSSDNISFESIQSNSFKIYPVVYSGVTYYPIYSSGSNLPTNYNLEVDFIPMRNLWVADFNLGISMIYYNNNTLAKNSTGGVLLDTSNYARDIVETLNGQDAYLSSWLSNDITKLSVSNYAVTNEINLDSPSLGLAITPNGKFIYIAGAGNPYVLVLSTSTDSVVATIPLPTNGYAAEIAITLNGKYAYVGDNGGGLVVISTGTNSVVDVIPSSEVEPWGVAVSTNGQFVYAADAGGTLNDNISVISTATNSVVGRIPVTVANSKNLAITPNGNYVYVTGQSSKVAVISTTTDAVVSYINLNTSTITNPGAEGLVITPNGQYVYTANFGNNGNRSVSVISTATNSVVDVITGFPDISSGPCSVNYGPLGSSC